MGAGRPRRLRFWVRAHSTKQRLANAPMERPTVRRLPWERLEVERAADCPVLRPAQPVALDHSAALAKAPVGPQQAARPEVPRSMHRGERAGLSRAAEERVVGAAHRQLRQRPGRPLRVRDEGH